MFWIILSAVAIALVIVMVACVLALLRAAAQYEEEYPHLTDYKSEWEEIKEENNNARV